MKLNAWGRYPIIDAEPLCFHNETTLGETVCRNSGLIPFGNGRSYGDCALFDNFLPMRRLDRFLRFDKRSGLLTCEAGVLLSDIVDAFLPRGWFPGVTPGTKLITVGGAIAADVHGKNHHVMGCFSDTVESLRLMLADGSVVQASRKENRELFLATCGGMGLTGIILDASFYLTKVASYWINQRIVKTANLAETFAAFEQNSTTPYSVAWIDCLQKEDALGRSVLMLGDFAEDGDLAYKEKHKVTVPCDFPSFALNSLSVKLFNALYYAKTKAKEDCQRVSIDSFFYPLDSIRFWNRIYGRGGFTQYQFILPQSASLEGLKKILSAIAGSGMGSFLAVLKLYGAENENYLSFPLKGYSLALDFKIVPGLFQLLDELDRVVLDYGGRIYLAKDVRVSHEVFAEGYSRIDAFKEIRERYDPNRKFRSLQSQRLRL